MLKIIHILFWGNSNYFIWILHLSFGMIKKNILWFKSQPFSQYWVDFFSKIKNKKNKRVLDLGCGVGRNTKMLSKLGFNFYACDNCKKMVDETKKSLKNIGFDEKFLERRITQQSMDNLSYPSNYFDFIISHGVYHSASSMREFKKRLRKVVEY